MTPRGVESFFFFECAVRAVVWSDGCRGKEEEGKKKGELRGGQREGFLSSSLSEHQNETLTGVTWSLLNQKILPCLRMNQLGGFRVFLGGG